MQMLIKHSLLPNFNQNVVITPIKLQHNQPQVIQLNPQDKQVEIEAYINSITMKSKLVYLKNKTDKDNKIDYENIINLKKNNGKDSISIPVIADNNNNNNSNKKPKISHNLQPYYTLQHNDNNTGDNNDNTLIFESRFECGNLLCAFKLDDYKYNLVLQNDTNTTGYIQWFFFSMSNTKKNHSINLNIINLLRKTSLYSKGFKIWCYSKQTAEKENIGWHRAGINTTYFINNYYMYSKGQRRLFYTLTFDYECKYDNDTIYFANSLPFLYSDLMKELNYYQIEENKYPFFHRKTLCSTLGNNDLDLITINSSYQFPTSTSSSTTTNSTNIIKDSRKGIVLMARQHPGETCSSYVMKGAIDFLMGNSDEAKKLRELYLIKIIPMMNPDGVVIGNSRTSYAGCDLNRRWISPNAIIYPEIYQAKEMINRMSMQREIGFICDFHGHIGAYNSFFYCNHKDNRRDCALFPYICSKISKVINYSQCDFKMPKYKNGTSRISLFKDLNIDNIATLETSFFGTSSDENNGSHGGVYFNAEMLKEIGRDVCLGMLSYYYKYDNKTIDKMINRDVIDIQLNDFKEIIDDKNDNDKDEVDNNNNDNLSVILDESSESEPSIDNFDKNKIMKLLPTKTKKKKRKYSCKSLLKKNNALSMKKLPRHDYFKGEISYFNPIKSTATSSLPLSKILPQTNKERYHQPIKLSNEIFSPKTSSSVITKNLFKPLNYSNILKDNSSAVIHLKQKQQKNQSTQSDSLFFKMHYSYFENQYQIFTPTSATNYQLLYKANSTTKIANKAIIRNNSFTSTHTNTTTYNRSYPKSINSLINSININNSNNNVPPPIIRVNSFQPYNNNHNHF